MSLDMDAGIKQIRERALANSPPYSNPDVEELVRMVKGYQDPHLRYFGTHPILPTPIVEDFLFTESDDRSKGLIIMVSKGDETIKTVIDLYDISYDPIGLLAHYSTVYPTPKFKNKMGEVPREIDDEAVRLDERIHLCLTAQLDTSEN